MIIDFHTHAFPDHIADKAIPTLENAGKVKAWTTGTIDSLLKSMDKASIDQSVICSIATHPAQFRTILSWSQAIWSKRIIPLPSIHPNDKKLLEHFFQIKAAGFPGIKMHPYYQDFELDEKRLYPLYEALSEAEMVFVVHCGYDIAFPKTRIADPAKILAVKETFPDLKLIATHFGGWKIWDEVESKLIGKEIHMEISFSLKYLPRAQVKRMLANHPREYVLFGSDSPWDDQSQCVERVRQLGLEHRLQEALLYGNGKRLLASCPGKP